MEGISLAQPQPKIPPELIKFLGKTFNAWNIAIPLLESHVIIFPDEQRCFYALAELYKQVRVQIKRQRQLHEQKGRAEYAQQQNSGAVIVCVCVGWGML